MLKSYSDVALQLLSASLESSFVFQFENEERILNGSRMFLRTLDLQIKDKEPGEIVDPWEIYDSLLAIEILTAASNDYMAARSNDIAPMLNGSVTRLNTVQSELEQVRDLVRIVGLYIGAEDRGTYTFRAYPKATNSVSRGALPSHVEKVKEVVTKALSQLSDLSDSTRTALDETSRRVNKLKTDKKGKAVIEATVDKGQITNGVKLEFGSNTVSLGSKSGTKVLAVEARQSDGSWTTINKAPSLIGHNANASVHVATQPILTDKLRVTLQTNPDNDEILMTDFKALNVEYKGEGEVIAKRFDVPRDIVALAIHEEDFVLPDELRPYFEINHLVRLVGDPDNEWYRLRPRNRDSYDLDLPEVLLVGSGIPGLNTLSINLDVPVRSFEYRSTFRKKRNIPQHVLGTLYLDRKSSEMYEELIPLPYSYGGNRARVTLTHHPLAKPEVFLVTGGTVSSDISKDGTVVGTNSAASDILLPSSILDVFQKDRIRIFVGELELTRTDSSSPSSNEFYIDENGYLQVNVSSSYDGREVRALIRPTILDLKLDPEDQNTLIGTLDPLPLSKFGHFRLFYRVVDTSEVARLSLSDFKEAYATEKVWAAKLGKTDLLSVTSVSAYYQGVDISSSIVGTSHTYKSGLEAKAGGYSVDLDKGIFYVKVDTATYSDPRDLHFEVEFAYSTKVEHKEWEIDGNQIRIKRAKTEASSLTISDLETSVPSIGTDFNIVENSVKVSGARRDDGINRRGKVTGQVLKYESRTGGGTTYFRLPKAPIDTSLPISVRDDQNRTGTKGGTSNGDYDIDSTKQLIEFVDNAEEVEFIVVSYSYTDTVENANSNKFAFDKKTNKIIMAEAPTDTLQATVLGHSYFAEYEVVEPLDDRKVFFATDNKRDLELDHSVAVDRIARNKDSSFDTFVLVRYRKAKTEGSVAQNGVPTDKVISLLPKHVDIEVKTQ